MSNPTVIETFCTVSSFRRNKIICKSPCFLFLSNVNKRVNVDTRRSCNVLSLAGITTVFVLGASASRPARPTSGSTRACSARTKPTAWWTPRSTYCPTKAPVTTATIPAAPRCGPFAWVAVTRRRDVAVTPHFVRLQAHPARANSLAMRYISDPTGNMFDKDHLPGHGKDHN